jgi:hypothetical protein
VKTARERAETKRDEKLALVRKQVESGSLVIRQMTDKERSRYPPRSALATRLAVSCARAGRTDRGDTADSALIRRGG